MDPLNLMTSTTRTNLMRTDRSTIMNVMHEDLARSHRRELLAEAAEHRRGRELVLARRLARRAERNAMRARLHLARLV